MGVPFVGRLAYRPVRGNSRMAPLGAIFLCWSLLAVADTFLGFVDVGYLRAEGARVLGLRTSQVRPDANAIVQWFHNLYSTVPWGQTLLRIYWYDGEFSPSRPEYGNQRRYFDAIGSTPGIQLRLGQIAVRESRLRTPIRRALRQTATDLSLGPDKLMAAFERNWEFRPDFQQKGVDTLIALDLVRLAGRSVCDTAVLVAGDRDLAEAIRAAQDFGLRILIATPNQSSIAREVAQLADALINISEDALKVMLPSR